MRGLDQGLQCGLVVELADAHSGLDAHLPVFVAQDADQRRADLFGRGIDQRAGGGAADVGVVVVLRPLDQRRQIGRLLEPADHRHRFAAHARVGVLHPHQGRRLRLWMAQRL